MNYRQHLGYYFTLSLVGIFLILLLLFLVFIVYRRRATKAQNTATLPKSSARSYSLADIDAATEGFNHLRAIGEGRLGTVYAAMSASGTFIAVKRIHPFLVLSNAGFDFSSIIKSLSGARHPHIIPIIGFCEAPGERIIVMEFVGVVSLDFYLHQNPDGSSLLDWNNRFRIAAGAARGLQYLHEEMGPSIVHGCVKPSNILIDSNFSARVCDYGLTFLAPKQKRGVAGYVDEEYWERKGNNGCKETDVYGFGVVLLEILSGRSCEEGWLVKWALPLIKQTKFTELFDPRVVVPFDTNPLVRMAKVASACVANSRKSRPTMGQVAAILNNLEVEVMSMIHRRHHHLLS